MRLGDLDHLLLKLDAEFSDDARYIDIADQIRVIIDNAPTVETKTIAECIIAYGDGYETARRLYERPQGEWIDPQDCFCYQCSNCGEYTNNEGTVKEGLFDFCPKCGAKMRGKEE